MQMQNIKGPGFVMVGDDDFLTKLLDIREVFHFTPKDEAGNITGPEMRFEMTTMRKFLSGSCAPIVPATFQQQNYDHIMSGDTIEEPKVRRLANRPDIYCTPVILLEWEDGTHVLADGNHRFVILWRMGIRRMPAYIVTKDIWQKFLV
jgi:hypothetical protein